MSQNTDTPKGLIPLYQLARMELKFRFEPDKRKRGDENKILVALEQWKSHLIFCREMNRGVIWRGDPRNRKAEPTLDELLWTRIVAHFREALNGKWDAIAQKMKDTGVDYKKTYEFFFPGSRTEKDYRAAQDHYKQYMLDNPEQEGIKPL